MFAAAASLEREDITGAPERASAMLTVLGTALEHAPTAPVLSRLPASMKVLLSLGRAAQDTPHALRGVIHCIGLPVATLRDAPSDAVVDEQWPHCAKAFGAVSHLCADGRPKVRKQAAASVAEALRALRGTPAADPAGRVRRHRREGHPRPRQSRSRAQDMHGSAGAKAAEQRAQAAATEALHVLGALKLVLGEIAEPAAAKSPPQPLPPDLAEPLLTQHACDALMILFSPTGASAAAAAAAARAARRREASARRRLKPIPESDPPPPPRPPRSHPRRGCGRRSRSSTDLGRVARCAHAAAVRRLHELDLRTRAQGLFGGVSRARQDAQLRARGRGHGGGAVSQRARHALRGCNMVREGIVDGGGESRGAWAAPARPPPVVGVANALKASLGFRYPRSMARGAPVVAAAFDRLGAASGAILGGCIEALGEMGAHAEGLACRGQLTRCIGAAVRALGPEQVLAVLPLRLEEGIDAEIQAKTEAGDDMDADEDDMDLGAGAGAELNAEGGNVAGAAGARLCSSPCFARRFAARG